jgi:hypothetical protein
MDQVREVLRIKHYAIRTEQAYGDWIKRYVRFYGMRCREDLFPGAEKVELFLSDLAVNGHVAAATQNQAFNALLFLYNHDLYACAAAGPQRGEKPAGLTLGNIQSACVRLRRDESPKPLAQAGIRPHGAGTARECRAVARSVCVKLGNDSCTGPI